MGAEGQLAGNVLVSWSGGKDSALALARLLHSPSVHVVGLLTTVTAHVDRINIHGVRRALLRRQADSLGLPLHEIAIPAACSNEAYEASWTDALRNLPEPMVAARSIAFGDLFLQDVRAYRERLLQSVGFTAVFPLWGEPTVAVAQAVLAAGIEARLVCVDTELLSADFAGVAYDEDLLERLPEGIDPCGERGEFHTFVSDGPGFQQPVSYRVGDVTLREARFAYCDLIPEVCPDA